MSRLPTESRPIMWRPDPLAEAQFALQVSRDLHRSAGLRGFSCMPKFSYTSRAYYAEMLMVTKQDNGTWKTWPNYRLGTGKTPLEAAIDGYLQCMPGDPLMLAYALEVQLHLLKEDVRVTRKLEALIESLTDLVQMVNPPWVCLNCIGMVEHGCYCAAMGAPYPGGPVVETPPDHDDVATLAASNTEDDDL